MTRTAALVLLLSLVLAACGATAASPPTLTTTSREQALDRPIVTYTPGVVITTSAADVCTPGWSKSHRRSLTARQEAEVLADYGYMPGQPVAEWDHLVSLELGGGNGTRNIWPQVDAASRHRKDLLENKLHWQVCNGGLDLKTAQSEVRAFWLYW